MNKKEITELKKSFKSDNGYFTMDRILTAFVDAEKNILYNNTHSTYTMTVEDRDIYDETLLKILNTNIGKNFKEFAFPNSAYEEGQPQNILYNVVKGELTDTEYNNTYIEHIVNNLMYTGPYTIITAFCVYNVCKKNSNDEFNEDSEDELYKFILTAICPADTGDDGFIFDSNNKEIIKKLNTELIINKAPSDGFIFPVFSNRSSDINYVGIYSKSKTKPNISMIADVMSCTFTTTSDVEKNNFQTILKTVVDEDLNYNFINNVNDKIKDIIDQNRDETEAATIDSNKLEDIFSECGLNQDRVNRVKPVYEKLCGDTELTAYNLVDYKTTVDIDGIKVNIKSYDTDKVRTSVIDGRRCLIIDIDDPTVEINGLPVTLN
jgi:hypothetical protein